jgi:hypothetical protein
MYESNMCTHAHAPVCVYACMYVCVYVYIYIYIYTYTLCIYVRMYLRLCVSVCMCVYIHTHTHKYAFWIRFCCPFRAISRSLIRGSVHLSTVKYLYNINTDVHTYKRFLFLLLNLIVILSSNNELREEEICRGNLQRKFAEEICRGNLQRKFANFLFSFIMCMYVIHITYIHRTIFFYL